MRVIHRIGARVALLVFVATSLGACSALYAGATTAPSPASAAPTAAVDVEAPTGVPNSSVSDPSSAAATAACSALLDEVPSTHLNSGKATLAAAYEVTGAQLDTYFERMHEVNGGGGYPLPWQDKPTKRLTMCIFDGDFTTLTPGPGGHDTSAPRVLVVIEDGLAQLRSIAREDPSVIPVTDPATLSQ